MTATVVPAPTGIIGRMSRIPRRMTPAGWLVVLGTATAAGALLPTSIRWVMTPAAFLVPGGALVTALFGSRWRPLGLRIALSALMSLAVYPVLAVATAPFTPITRGTVACTVWLFVLACAAVVARRDRVAPRADDDVADHALEGKPPAATAGASTRRLLWPAVAILVSMVIAWAGIRVLPRQAPDEFHAVELAGTWPLVEGVTEITAGEQRSVTFEVVNHTSSPHRYEVFAGVTGGPEWATEARAVELAPGERRELRATGTVDPGMCTGELLLGVRADDGRSPRPLRLIVRDTGADCG